MASSIPPAVRAVLVCPSCRGELTDAPAALLCEAEQFRYPVVDGVPHLVRESAKKIRTPSKAR